MNKLVISGYYGFGNAGDEAMLAAMVTALRSLDPSLQITVISGNPADTCRRYGVSSIHKFNVAGIIRVLRQADLLVSGGGSLLQDVTSGRSIFYYLAVIKLADLVNCPVMLYAQGIGPIRSSFARSFMKHVGNRIVAGTVRDEGSRNELARLGFDLQRIAVTADPVLALEPVSLACGDERVKELNLSGEGPLIGFSVREWQGQDHFKRVMAAVADRLALEIGAKIVFLPMQQPDDLVAAQQIAARMRMPYAILEKPVEIKELLSVVGNLDFLVGVRLHALIFATVMNIPFVGISYDPKIDRFLESIGEKSAGALGDLDEQALYAKILNDLGDVDARRRREKKLEELRQAALQNAEWAIALLQGIEVPPKAEKRDFASVGE